MTSTFGRRNRASAPPVSRPAPDPELVLTPEQRALLLGAPETNWNPGAADGKGTAAAPVRRAGLIACAAVTAVVVALQAFGEQDPALAGLPGAVAPMGRDLLSLIGACAGPLTLIWSIVVNFANFSANLWLTRKLAARLGAAGLPAYIGLGAALGAGAAWLSCVTGMGDSAIGYGMEALAGAGVAGLYLLLSGSARP